jgi:hypothetical protein
MTNMDNPITPTPPPNRIRLRDEIASRKVTRSLFALAVDLSIPYPKASEYLRDLERSGQVQVTRYCPGYPLVITWIGDHDA